MNPLFKLVWIIVVIAVIFWLVTKFRDRNVPQATGHPVPVSTLAPSVISSIDHQLTSNRPIAAIKIYRDATRAPLGQAKAAVDQRKRELGG